MAWGSATKYLKHIYRRLLITFKKEVNTAQVTYSIWKSEEIHMSKKITLYVGNSPVSSLLDITSTTVNLLDNAIQ
jgi:hypothetical protein